MYTYIPISPPSKISLNSKANALRVVRALELGPLEIFPEPPSLELYFPVGDL